MKKWVQRVACFMLLITLWAGWFTLTVKALLLCANIWYTFCIEQPPILLCWHK